MPIYEFQCQSCGRRFSELVGLSEDASAIPCPKCGERSARKLVSRFARARSEDSMLDDLSNRLDDINEPDSPAAMRRMVREMGKAMDEDAADDMEEMFEADMEGGGDEDADLA